MRTFSEMFESSLMLFESRPVLKLISDFSDAEIRKTLGKLSDTERAQLGTKKATGAQYMTEEEWVRLRDYYLQQAKARSAGTPDDMCAYTPGETITLLNNGTIKSWFSKMRSFKIPENKKSVVFVSCAGRKPWGEGTTSLQYKTINKIRSMPKYKDIYWVTISEPLGVVPEKHWDDFPMYDNPGLFKNMGPVAVTTAFWKANLGKEKSYIHPFDEKLSHECFKILGGVIKDFYSNNKQIKTWISAVETRGPAIPSNKSTHGHMLDFANIIEQELRFQKSKDARDTAEGMLEHYMSIADKCL